MVGSGKSEQRPASERIQQCSSERCAFCGICSAAHLARHIATRRITLQSFSLSLMLSFGFGSARTLDRLDLMICILP